MSFILFLNFLESHLWVIFFQRRFWKLKGASPCCHSLTVRTFHTFFPHPGSPDPSQGNCPWLQGHKLRGRVSDNYGWINRPKLSVLIQTLCMVFHESVGWLGSFSVGLSWTHSCGCIKLTGGLDRDSWAFLSKKIDGAFSHGGWLLREWDGKLRGLVAWAWKSHDVPPTTVYWSH